MPHKPVRLLHPKKCPLEPKYSLHLLGAHIRCGSRGAYPAFQCEHNPRLSSAQMPDKPNYRSERMAIRHGLRFFSHERGVQKPKNPILYRRLRGRDEHDIPVFLYTNRERYQRLRRMENAVWKLRAKL